MGLELGRTVKRFLSQIRGCQNKISGGGDNVPFPEKNAFFLYGNPKTGTRKKSREGNASAVYANSVRGDPLLFRGPSKPSPGGHLPTPRARRRVLWPGAPRAAVWGGRGAIARSRCPVGHILVYTKTENVSSIQCDVVTNNTSAF